MKISQRKSKRISTRTRVKIARKAREHHRKSRKEARKTKHMPRKQQVQIPRMAPFKKDILKDIQRMKEAKQAELEMRKSVRRLNKARGSEAPKSVSDAGHQVMDDNTSDESKMHLSGGLVKPNNFSSHLNQVIEKADLIIEVIDARDPISTRCEQLEGQVLRRGKSLLLLMNKVDLIPRDNCADWLRALRSEYPTIPYRANGPGTNDFIHRLFSAIKVKSAKCGLTVGVVGFPNVGKSSVINCLKGQKCCESGSVAGMTRDLKEIRLDKRVRLIDSPGVVLTPSKYSETDLALLNAIDLSKVSDPLSNFEALMARCGNEEELTRFYRLPATEESFIDRLARRYGFLKKGGQPNVKMAALKVLRDWACGRLLYHTRAPPRAPVDHIMSSELIPILEQPSLVPKEVQMEEIPGGSDDLCKPSIEIAWPLVPATASHGGLDMSSSQAPDLEME